MLAKLVEKQTPDSVEVHLAEIMPGLLKVFMLVDVFFHINHIFPLGI